MITFIWAVVALVVVGFIAYAFGNNSGHETGYANARRIYSPTPAVTKPTVVATKPAPKKGKKVAKTTKRGRKTRKN